MRENLLLYAAAHEWLCNDYDFASRYNIPSMQYMTDPDGNNHPGGPSHNEPAGFDLESIMLYPSVGFAHPWCYHDMNFCPVLRKNPREMIPLITHPSDKDAMFIQRWYPSVPGAQ
jgi:hypothetical protein